MLRVEHHDKPYHYELFATADWRTDETPYSRLGFVEQSGLAGDVLQVVHDAVRFGHGDQDAGIHKILPGDGEGKHHRGGSGKNKSGGSGSVKANPLATYRARLKAQQPTTQISAPPTNAGIPAPPANPKPVLPKTTKSGQPIKRRKSGAKAKPKKTTLPAGTPRTPLNSVPHVTPVNTKPKKDGPAARRKSTPDDIPDNGGVNKTATKDVTVKGKRHGQPGEAHIKKGQTYKVFKSGAGTSLYREGDGHFLVDPADVGKLK